LYNSSKSSTHKPNGANYSYTLVGSLIYSGIYSEDNVRIGELMVTNQIFAELSSFPQVFAGVVGLGLSSSSSLKEFPTVLDNLFAQHQISKKTFAIYLNRYLKNLLVFHEKSSPV